MNVPDGSATVEFSRADRSATYGWSSRAITTLASVNSGWVKISQASRTGVWLRKLSSWHRPAWEKATDWPQSLVGTISSCRPDRCATSRSRSAAIPSCSPRALSISNGSQSGSTQMLTERLAASHSRSAALRSSATSAVAAAPPANASNARSRYLVTSATLGGAHVTLATDTVQHDANGTARKVMAMSYHISCQTVF